MLQDYTPPLGLLLSQLMDTGHQIHNKVSLKGSLYTFNVRGLLCSWTLLPIWLEKWTMWYIWAVDYSGTDQQYVMRKYVTFVI